MAERGVHVSHTTIRRRVQRYVPGFEKRRNRYARPVGSSWRVDETYIRVRGRWTGLYRAVERQGLTVDSLPSERRDIAAAKLSFTHTIKKHGPPQMVTPDGDPATHAALSELKAEEVLPRRTMARASKYLNHLIEPDHRRVKQRIYPRPGFKRFAGASVAISGIELVNRVRKGQSDTSSIKQSGVREPHIRELV